MLYLLPGQFSYPNAYQAGGVVSHSHDYGSYGQPNTDESYYRPDVSQYQPGSQPGYGGAPQPGYNAQRFDYEDDLTPRNQNSNVDGGDDYLTNDGEEHDYYDGDASAVESSAGSSSGNGVQNARDSGKMGYGGGLQQYGPQGQDVYGGGGGGGGGGYGGGGGGVGGYGGGGGGGGGVGGYGGGGGGYGGGGGGYSPQYSNQQYTGYSYSNMYQPQQQPKVIKVIERVPIKEKIYVPVYKKRKKKSKHGCIHESLSVSVCLYLCLSVPMSLYRLSLPPLLLSLRLSSALCICIIHRHVSISIYLPTQPPTRPSIHMCVCMYVCMSVHPPVRSTLRPSIHPSIRPSIHPSHISIYLFVCMSVCISVVIRGCQSVNQSAYFSLPSSTYDIIAVRLPSSSSWTSGSVCMYNQSLWYNHNHIRIDVLVYTRTSLCPIPAYTSRLISE